MKLDEKFNLKTAQPVEAFATVKRGPRFASRMCVEFCALPGDDRRTLRLHLTPLEALEFAKELIEAARLEITDGAR